MKIDFSEHKLEETRNDNEFSNYIPEDRWGGTRVSRRGPWRA